MTTCAQWSKLGDTTCRTQPGVGHLCTLPPHRKGYRYQGAHRCACGKTFQAGGHVGERTRG